MIEPSSERRIPISPALAMRVAVLGGIAFVLFAVIFFRLWYLQVLSGDQYLAQATQNRIRSEPKQAPRGNIVDRNGDSFVRNRQATVLRLDPAELPESERELAAEWGQQVIARSKRPDGQKGDPIPVPDTPPELVPRFRQLSRITGVSVREIQERTIIGLYQTPYAGVRIKADVDADVRGYIEERREKFPGVSIDQVYVRKYPFEGLASQLVGTVSEVSPEQLRSGTFRDVEQGVIVGQEGLEREYDRFLRGVDGEVRTSVDADGVPVEGSQRETEPTPGRQVELSLDLRLQRSGQRALARYGRGNPGAFVAMDPHTGDVLAMGSSPSFDPNELSKPISQKRYDALFGEEAGSPRFNRAIGASYPVGSTFKPIAALAALDEGLITPQTIITDTGCANFGIGQGSRRCNAKQQPYGAVDLVKSLRVSSDIYYYTQGQDLYNRGRGLQEWSRKLGLGRRTGIDLPQEFPGNVPDRKWRERLNKEEASCRKRNDGRPCGIADGENRPYSVGDNVSLAIGQGDLQATPLQMAVVYATLANGGRVVRPHLAQAVQDDQGRLIQRLERGASRRVKLPQAGLAAIREGLRQAASAPGGTSTSVFAGWNHKRFPVHGKTGTAQVNNKLDQSWYVAYVPKTATNSKPIVVVATVEQGGFGAESAAPTVCRMLSTWYRQPNARCTPAAVQD